MANEKKTLYIAKTTDISSKDSDFVFDSDERGKTVDFTILDIDEQPYDLTDLTIKFVELIGQSDTKNIIDEDTNNFVREDASGKFSYTFPSAVYHKDGRAHFEFWKNDSKIDTTMSFRIQIRDASPSLENTDYISAFEKLKADFQGKIQDAEDSTKKALDNLQVAITDGKGNIDDEIKDAQKQVSDLIDKTQQEVNKLNDESQATLKQFGDLNKQLEKLQELADNLKNDTAEIADIKAKLNKLSDTVASIDLTPYVKKDDLTTTLADYEKTSDAQSALNDKADKADTYTKTEIDSKVTDLNSAIANTGKVKTISIDGGTPVVPDDKGNADLSIPKQDLTPYAKTSDVNDEINTKTSGMVKSVNGIKANEDGNVDIPKQDLTPYAKTEDVNTELGQKADKDTTYTKEEVDQAVANAKPDLSPYAKTEDIDKEINDKTSGMVKSVNGINADENGNVDIPKQDLSEYAKTADVDTKLDDKANKADIYTKAEMDETVTKLNSDIANGGKLKTVSVNNGTPVEPDDKGNANITVEAPDLTPYAKTEDVTAELKEKANSSDIYNKEEIDTKLGTKVTFKKCDSPQAAYDISSKPAEDGSIVIGVYDPDDGPTSAVIGDKKITVSSLYDSLTALQTQVSGLSNLQNLVNGKANSADVYSKSDVDKLLSQIKDSIASAAQGGKIDLTDYAKAKDVDDKLADKANKVDVYTKAEVDNTVAKLSSDIANGGKLKTVSINGGKPIEPDDKGNADITVNEPDLSDYVKTADINTKLDDKADKATTYTKDEVDQAITKATPDLTNYAKTADVSKELDDKVAEIKGSESKLKSISVDGGDPLAIDDSGNTNIDLPKPDLSAYAKTEDVDTKLKDKADTSTVTEIQDNVSKKADTADVTANATDIKTLKEQLTKALSELDDANNEIAELKKRKLFNHFKTQQEAIDWSGQHDGIAVVDDPNDATTNNSSNQSSGADDNKPADNTATTNDDKTSNQ